MQKITLKIKGMVCHGCENRLENALKNIEGIKKVKADYQKETVQVAFQEENSKDLIYKTIENMGFKIEEDE